MSSPSSSPRPASVRASRVAVLRAWWFWGLLVALAAGGGWYYTQSAPSTPAGEPGKEGRRGGERSVPVTLGQVAKGDVRVLVSALGNVIPRNQVTVRSRVDGQLVGIEFTEGQLVKAGDVLARIDPEPFKATLEQARGQLARDQALLKNARLDLERYQTLLAQDSISRQQLDTQDALVRQYQGTVQADEGAVRTAELQLSYTTVRAPMAGRVGLRQVDPGNMIKSTDTNGLVVLSQTTPVTVVFAVPEERLGAILKGMKAKGGLMVEAWDRELRVKQGEGRLLAVDSQIDTATGTIKLKAEFANADGTLFPNQFVNVRVLLDVQKDVLTVPVAALQQGAKGRFVFRVNAENRVSPVPVRLGPVDGPVAAVEDGLAEGDKIVVDGLDKLREGAKVEPVDPNLGASAKKRGGPGGPGRPAGGAH